MCLLTHSVLQEQGEGLTGTERGGLRRTHTQQPYFLSSGAQDQAVIKAGYCVKQGAVVGTHKHALSPVTHLVSSSSALFVSDYQSWLVSPICFSSSSPVEQKSTREAVTTVAVCFFLFSSSDEKLEEEVLHAGRELHQLLQI